MISPIFPAIGNLKSAEVRVYMPSVSPTNPSGLQAALPMGTSLGLRVRVDVLTTSDFSSATTDVVSAENTILNIPSVINHDVEWSTDSQISKAENAKLILLQASQYATNISMTSRRGVGNIFLMGSEVYKNIIENFDDDKLIKVLEPELVGRWTKLAKFIGTVDTDIYTCDDFAANDIAVLHVGPGSAIDGPGGLITDANGDLHLRVMPNISTAMCNASDYIRRFHVNFK